MMLRFSQVLILLIFVFCSLFAKKIANVSVWDVMSLEDFQLEMYWDILCISRIPRTVSILIAGSSLALAGLIMQSITCNRFVSPTTAGTMDWARLGVMVAIICYPDASPMFRILLAFVISLVGTSLFVSIISKVKQANIIVVPLIGIMLGAVVSSIATFFAYQYDIVQNMASWLQGNFSLVVEGEYEFLYISVPFMALAYLYADRFTIAGMGGAMTTTLGLNHAHIVRVGLVIVSVISSISIVGVGNLPFIGLIVPNVVSLLRGDSVKHTLFDTAWLGAVLVLICDLAARLIIEPYEIPVGVILSVVGSIIFLVLLLKRRRYA